MINKLGFGFMRLPKKEETLDWEQICHLVDLYMDGGGKFFDTFCTYLQGDSEIAICKCLTQRKPRESFLLCDKLPGYKFSCYEDCQKHFDSSLQRCGVTWFDVLLLHWMNEKNYAIAEELEEFRFLREKKAEGLAKRIGFSFHGSASLLDKILTAHPEVDLVLMQLNYLDWESEGIQSRACYETCLRHGKKVMVMEPVKGGTLASLPEEAERLLKNYHPDWTPADWALRFVQSLPGVEVCLSGMGTAQQVSDNIKPFAPLIPEEVALLAEAAKIIWGEAAIGCTGCSYCLPHCPQKIPIPQYIKMHNEYARYAKDGWKIKPSYHRLALSAGKASDCIGCHSCEKHCPQNLPIAESMKIIAEELEN